MNSSYMEIRKRIFRSVITYHKDCEVITSRALEILTHLKRGKIELIGRKITTIYNRCLGHQIGAKFFVKGGNPFYWTMNSWRQNEWTGKKESRSYRESGCRQYWTQMVAILKMTKYLKSQPRWSTGCSIQKRIRIAGVSIILNQLGVKFSSEY